MGLLDEYGIDVENEVPDAAGFDEVPDDIYEFDLGNVYIQQGTSNHPDKNSVVFEYLLGETGLKKTEWFGLPEDSAAPSDKELMILGFYKARLLSLGVEKSELNTVTGDDLIGLRGTLQVFTNKKGYQNIKNVRLAESDAPEEAPAAAAPAAKAPAVRKAPAANKAAAPAASTAVNNPFAKK